MSGLVARERIGAEGHPHKVGMDLEGRPVEPLPGTRQRRAQTRGVERFALPYRAPEQPRPSARLPAADQSPNADSRLGQRDPATSARR